MTPLLRISLALVLMLAARAALAHEFWIEAREYQVDTGAPVDAGIFNGQDFAGPELAWFERRIAAAAWISGDAQTPFENRSGERPALKIAAAPEGLLTLIYQSTATELTYSEWQKFEQFVTSKGFPEAAGRHRARGLPETGIKEIYTRYCKALLAAGDGEGADRARGMEAELVALANPYAALEEGILPVAILYQGAARGGAQLDVFERTPEGDVTLVHVLADAEGVARVKVKPGHRYLLDSVMLREAGGDAMWESLWASLTFEIPQ